MATDKSDMPSVTVPLDAWVKTIIRETLEEHVKQCPILPRVSVIEERVTALRIGFAKLIGMMIGAGSLGGGLVAMVNHLIF